MDRLDAKRRDRADTVLADDMKPTAPLRQMRKDEIPDRYEYKRFYTGDNEWVNTGDSAIVDPNGQFIAGPVHAKEEILYAEVDPAQIDSSRWMFDVAGHYARPDVFQLTVQQEPRPMITSDGGAAKQPSPKPKPKRRTRRK